MSNIGVKDENFGNVFSIPTDPEMNKDLDLVDKITRRELAEKNNINLPYAWLATTIADVYIKNLIKVLAIKVKENAGDGADSVMINFQDIIECHLSERYAEDAEKEGNINIFFRPGYQAKLIVKSDDLTEDDFEDEGDD